MMWGYPDGFSWWMVFGGVWMLLFWGVIIGLIVWGVSRLTGGKNASANDNETSLEIAEKRLTKGEITRAQFEEIKEVLQT